MYVFISYANPVSCINLGACVIECEEVKDAPAKSKQLGLEPEDHYVEGKAYILDEEGFQDQGMELNRFYTREWMKEMEFEKG